MVITVERKIKNGFNVPSKTNAKSLTANVVVLRYGIIKALIDK